MLAVLFLIYLCKKANPASILCNELNVTDKPILTAANLNTVVARPDASASGSIGRLCTEFIHLKCVCAIPDHDGFDWGFTVFTQHGKRSPSSRCHNNGGGYCAPTLCFVRVASAEAAQEDGRHDEFQSGQRRKRGQQGR